MTSTVQPTLAQSGDEMFDVFYIHHPENEDDPPFQLVASRKEYYGSTTVWIQWGEPNE